MSNPIDTPVNDGLTINIKPHWKCPKCNAPMMIAAKYDKSDQNVEGIAKVNQHLCLQCQTTVTPIKL